MTPTMTQKRHNRTITSSTKPKLVKKRLELANLWCTLKKRDRMNNTSIKSRNYLCSRQRKRQENVMTITPIHQKVQAKWKNL